MIDINVDENATSVEKITINSRSVNFINSNKNSNYNDYSTIKCYKSLPSITTLEAKAINIIKIHKTIFFNLSNLINIDLRDNKLLKISNNFKLFKNLKSLKLDYNQISFIPSFIGELIHLETFTISSNLISYMPTSIQNLTSLKTFNFSNNRIERLPIEFGQLAAMQTLYMDGNYLMAIPTTLCYLKRLSELSFDWLEFVEPPYYRIIKDSVGKTIICIIVKCLESMLKQSILYCDFKTFVEKISPKKSEESEIEKSLKINNPRSSASNREELFNSESAPPLAGAAPGATLLSTYKINQNHLLNKFNKIFHAIENGYNGIIKSFLESENVEEYLKVKNQENKTAFYMAINNKNDDIIDLFLEKIKEQKIQLSYIYLFKAIRTRNPELVKKLVNFGIKVDSIDDNGKGVFHVLFNSFTKQIARCTLIGDFLLEKGAPVNNFDGDNWAPIHIAANKSCKQCLLWIIASNKKLRKEGKEVFDLNLKGKNNWTPLHLTISSFRIEETLILLEQGCDIFARNIEAKTPKKVSLCNFVFSKLLSHFEFVKLREKYDKKNDNEKNYKNEIFHFDGDKYNKDKQKEDRTLNHYNSLKNNNRFNNNNNFINNNNDILKRGETFNKLNLVRGNPSINNSNNNINKNIQKSKNTKNKTNLIISSNDKFMKNKKIKNNESEIKDFYFNLPNEQKVADISSIINEESNINIQKEKLLSSESSLNEKYESFMFIKLNKSCNSEIIRSILDNMDLANSPNINIISDICNYIISNLMINLIPTLKNLLTNKLLEKNYFIIKELKNTINILEKVINNAIIPVNKQKTKISSKSIKNRLDDEEEGGKFIQDSGLMNEDLIEDDNDNELNFDMMNEMWTKQENNQKEKNDIKKKDKNNNFLNSVINKKNNSKRNSSNITKGKETRKIKVNKKI